MDQPAAPQTDRPISEIVDRIEQVAQRDRVRVGDMVAAFGNTAFLPALMIPALLVVSPLSGIPFFSSLCGILIALIAGQMVLRRRYLWLPDVLMRRHFAGARAREAMTRLSRIARWLDDRARDRFAALMVRPARKWVQILCVICGAAMPLLEVVPFSSSILGAAVLFFATGLLFRDGLLVLLGYAVLCLVALVPLTLVGAI